MDSGSFQRSNETECLLISNLPAFENDAFRIDQSVYAKLRTLHEETVTAFANLSFRFKRTAILLYNSLKPGENCEIVNVTNLLMEFMSDDMKGLFKLKNRSMDQAQTVRNQRKKIRVYVHRILQYVEILQRNKEQDEHDMVMDDIYSNADREELT